MIWTETNRPIFYQLKTQRPHCVCMHKFKTVLGPNRLEQTKLDWKTEPKITSYLIRYRQLLQEVSLDAEVNCQDLKTIDIEID